MSTDLVLIDSQTGKMLELGWMDDIIDFNFGHTFFLEVSGGARNQNPDPFVPDDVIAPTAAVTFSKTVVKLSGQVTSGSNSSDIFYSFMWVPAQSAVVGFTFFPTTPVMGTIGWDSFEAMLSHYGGVQTLVGLGNRDGFGVLNSAGNITGPVIMYEPDDLAPVPLDWNAVTTKAGPIKLTTARAEFWAAYLLAQPVAVDGGPPVTLYYAPGPVNANSAFYSAFREHSVGFDFLFKFTGSSTPPKDQVTVVLSNVLTSAGCTCNLNVRLYTTSDPLGKKNFTGAQVKKIKTASDIFSLGASADASTGLSQPTLVNGKFSFSGYRKAVKPPLLLYQGAHIKATPPIPSV